MDDWKMQDVGEGGGGVVVLTKPLQVWLGYIADFYMPRDLILDLYNPML